MTPPPLEKLRNYRRKEGRHRPRLETLRNYRREWGDTAPSGDTA